MRDGGGAAASGQVYEFSKVQTSCILSGLVLDYDASGAKVHSCWDESETRGCESINVDGE